MYKIESGIPVPKTRAKRPPYFKDGYCRYPFRDMKIGQSFMDKTNAPTEVATRIRSAATHLSKRDSKFLFTIRIVKGGVRVWRIRS